MTPLRLFLSIALSFMSACALVNDSTSSKANNPSFVSDGMCDTSAEQELAMSTLNAINDEETNADYSKTMVNASVAYDLGLTGCGVAVAVVDSGLTTEPHPELPRPRVLVTGADDFGSDGYVDTPGGNSDPTKLSYYWSNAFHGQGVSGVIAAAGDGVGMHGIAPAAAVQMYTLTFSASDQYFPISLYALGFQDPWLDNVLKSGMERGNILNMSWGLQGGIDSSQLGTGEPLYTEAKLRVSLPLTLERAAQASTHPDERKIFVWAAGNTGLELSELANPSSPEILPGLAALIPELQGHWLAVVAVQASGHLAEWSARCGIAQEFCLAAPGQCIIMPSAWHSDELPPAVITGRDDCITYSPDNPDFVRHDGTSFSAPIVTGALALMTEAFRGQYGNTNMVSRLLATANKTNMDMDDDGLINESLPDYSDTDIYGHGLLDIGAAVQPVGDLSLLLPVASVPLHQLALSGSPELSSLAASLSGHEIMLTDEMGAPFWYPFEQLPGAVSAPASPLPPVAASLQLHANHSGDWQHLWVRQLALNGEVRDGYRLEHRSNSSPLALFAGIGMHPGWMTAIYAEAMHTGGNGVAAFTAPWLDVVASSALGGGVIVPVSGGEMALMHFVGRPHRFERQLLPNDGAAPPFNQLWLAEYRHRAGALSWLLQSGLVRQPLKTSSASYGDFSGRTDYVGAALRWEVGADWQLLVAIWQAEMEMTPLPARDGLLQSVSPQRQSQLELRLMSRSVFFASDRLSLYGKRLYGEDAVAVWQLPSALSRGQVQYREVQTQWQGAGWQQLELNYALSSFSGANLMFRLGQQSALSPVSQRDGYAIVQLSFGL